MNAALLLDGDVIDGRTCPACGTGRKRLLRVVQPESTNGSPEPIIERHATAAAQVTGDWSSTIANAATGDNASAINRQILAALSDEHLEEFARPVEQGLVHSIMLGALDSAFEVSSGDTVAAPEFKEPDSLKATQARRSIKLAQSVVPLPIPGFDRLPYQQAIDAFLALHPVPRRVFDALADKAKLRAFTIARMSSVSIIRTVQRELARQVARGADLRDFRKFVAARLEASGWTPANTSHVETIFRTNVMKAYSAGRVEHMMRPSVLRARPFWRVLTVNDGPPRQRRKHQAQHGKVLRADNPIWARKMTPWGFNCRCRVGSVPASYKGEIWLDLEGVPDPGFISGVEALL